MVLVADNQEWSLRSIESILGPEGYAVLRAFSGQQTLDLARVIQPDVIIIESSMHDMTSVQICEALRADPAVGPSIPIVVATTRLESRSERLAAHRAGAWEVWGQPLDAELLLLRLENYVRAKREIDRVREESMVDAATGLYSPRGLAKRAREMGAEAVRRKVGMAAVAVTAQPPGNIASDEFAAAMVEQMADILRRCSRLSDAIGRVGQSEFAIVAPATENEGVLRLLERLRVAVESSPISLGGVERPIMMRAGYCAVPNLETSTVDVDEMLLRATKALQYARSTEGAPMQVNALLDLPVKYLQ
ncbi:MAG: response regulator [Gemmatimonadetes bacterium]|nr:response regulator [Gemmatimonadota bacterium]